MSSTTEMNDKLSDLAAQTWNEELFVPSTKQLILSRPLMVFISSGFAEGWESGDRAKLCSEIQAEVVRMLEDLAPYSQITDQGSGESAHLRLVVGREAWSAIWRMLKSGEDLDSMLVGQSISDILDTPDFLKRVTAGDTSTEIELTLLSTFVLPEPDSMLIELQDVENDLPGVECEAFWFDVEDGKFKSQSWIEAGERDTGYLWATECGEDTDPYEGDATPGRQALAKLLHE